MEFCRFSNGIQISVILALLSIMRELLILPLLAFLLHCSWADDPPPVDCHNLELKTKSGEQQHAFVSIGKVDENEWKRFSSELQELQWVRFDIFDSNIKVANFPRLRKVHGGPALNVLDNPVLVEFSLNAEGSDTMHFFSFVISENSQLKKVKVTAADASKFEISGGTLRLIKNKALENIDLPENGIYKDINNGFHVKGNPRLKKASLDSLRKLSANIQKKYIQDEGECVFIMEEPYESDIEISDVTELKGCKYVNGDLILAKGVNGSVGDIDHLNVTGAVYLKDPDVKQLSFLTSTTFTSPIECYFTDEVANLDVFQLCTKVQKDLTITGQVGGSGANSVLKEINGSVHLKDPNTGRFDFLTGITNGGIDCTFDVEVTNLDVFRACPKVIGDLKISGKVSGSGANSELKEITGSVHLKDPKNGQFDFLSGINKVDLDCSFAQEVTNWDIFNLCKTVTGDLKLAKSVNGTAITTGVTNVAGKVHINNPKVEFEEFLDKITGSKICHFDVEINDLTVFKMCQTVEGDLNFGAKVNGSQVTLAHISGNVYLNNWEQVNNKERFEFLKGASIIGKIVCRFTKEITDLTVFKLCQKVDSDVKFAEKISGTAVLPPIKGNVHLKNPKLEKLNFVNKTNVAGRIVCRFDGEVSNLAIFKLCQKVDGDLNLPTSVQGSAANSSLAEIKGNVNLKDPKMEQIDLLNGTTVTGHIVCHFDNKIANLTVFKRCQMVDSDLNLTESVTGSAENGHVLKVNGNVDLKHAREEQLGFLNGTNITGQIVSCHLTSLHGVNVTKGNCTSLPPTGGHYGSGGGVDLDEDEEENKDSIFKKPWMIATISGVAALIIILVVVGLLLYCCYFKKRSARATYTGTAKPVASKTGKTKSKATTKTGKTTSTTPKTGTTKTATPKTPTTDTATPKTDPVTDPATPNAPKTGPAPANKNTAVPPGNNKNTVVAPANPNKNAK